MRKPLRITALTAAAAAALALGACSDGEAGDNAGGTPSSPASSNAADPESVDSVAIPGEWEYIPDGYPGAVAGFTVETDGTVSKFWKEGTKGVGSATIKPYHGGWALDWKYTDADGGVIDGSYLIDPYDGGDSLTATVVKGDGTVTFTRVA